MMSLVLVARALASQLPKDPAQAIRSGFGRKWLRMLSSAWTRGKTMRVRKHMAITG